MKALFRGSFISIVVFLFMVAAGLAGNHFKYSIFLNIDFLWGSIFSMLTLQLFGLGRGVVAAAMIASYTYILWNHPYAIVIMTTEVMAVGLLMNRKKMSMVLSDALYWIFIGMPLVYFFYYVVMNLSINNVYMTMLKQGMNGITNALLARMFFIIYEYVSKSSLVSFKDISCNAIVFFILFPSLGLLAINSRSDFDKYDHNIRTNLIQESTRITYATHKWVKDRKNTIVNISELATSMSTVQIQNYLELVMKSDFNFLRIGILDKDANITAFYPQFDEFGQKNIGKNFADRPFISVLKQNLNPMLSEVVMGRIGNPKPMVTMLAPLVVSGEYEGYATGILSLEEIQNQLEVNTKFNSTLYTLLDKNNNIIMTNRHELKVMEPFVRNKGSINHLDDHVEQWVPVVPLNTSISDRWGKSLYFTESAIGDFAEWKLLLEQPVAPFQRELFNLYSGHLTKLFLVILGVILITEVLTRRSIATLEELRLITRNIPTKLAGKNVALSWPKSGIMETSHLISNFREMFELLLDKFEQIQALNTSLEMRVQERTSELRLESSRLQNLLETASDGIHVLDFEGNLIFCSPSFAQMLGYDLEELTGANVAVWDAKITASDIKPLIQSIIRTPQNFETSHICKNGSIINVEVNAHGVELDGKTFLYASARNITKRKNLEKVKDDVERIVRHDIKSPLSGLVHFSQYFNNDDNLTSTQREMINMVDIQARKVLNVINNSLEIFKIEEGTYQFNPTPCNPGIMILEIISMLSTSLHFAPGTVQVQDNATIAQGNEFCFQTDVLLLDVVLTNLLQNALENSGIDDRVIVDLSFVSNELTISISNSYSVPVEIRDRFFDKYVTFRKKHGTGLGTYSAAIMTRALGGRIEMKTSDEFGTIVSIHLPIKLC